MRITVAPLKVTVEAYNRNLVVKICSRCLWVGWFTANTNPIAHPKGKAWGLWTEEGELFSIFGPLLLTLGRV